MFGDSDPWSHDIHAQALAAIAEADVIIYMLDFTTDPLQQDKDLARLLRKQGVSDSEELDEAGRTRKPVLLVVNKVDNPDRFEAVGALKCVWL
jgi:predicted GTPase